VEVYVQTQGLIVRSDGGIFIITTGFNLGLTLVQPFTLRINIIPSHRLGCGKLRLGVLCVASLPPNGKNGFVTATKLGTTNKIFVPATKNFAAATKRFDDRTKDFVVRTKYLPAVA